MTMSDEQQKAVAALRAHLTSISFPLGTAESADQRARHPDPAHLPADVTVRIEIAPPSAQPHPLLDASTLKTPEHVPLHFYTLRDQIESDPANTNVIFFIHGGGNIAGHPADPKFIPLFAQLLRACTSHSRAGKYLLIAPSYRLATVSENAFPAALQDLVAAYDYVLSQGYNPANIVIAGDSAGGNHAVVLAHLAIQSGGLPPHAVIPIAPYAIQSLDGLSEQAKANARTDILDLTLLETFARQYAGDSGVAPTDPLASGVYIPFAASWPKTLILVGTGDVLIDGSHELVKRLSARNLAVELVEYGGYPHGWWTMPDVFPEAFQDAAQRIARFIL